ncbi:hypothetical protein DPX16_0346 [Anabarilius grahami]|uniref:Uncharacterized protein n=1 Tax=Anabarilius grahami TaxID=495550 RepID=A0A3N0XLI7_ANAGA|nr:hypothetical protein DPX16_0346 [Anabarilius grahami]
MDIPAVRLLCLEQGEQTLEDNTRTFIETACFTHYPDYCTFYRVSLNAACRAQLSREGPQPNFAAFVEWELVNCNSSFTICLGEEDLASTTPDPDPDQQPSRSTECSHEPSPRGATELRLAAESERDETSDPVREPAAALVKELTVESEGVEESPAHCTAAEATVWSVVPRSPPPASSTRTPPRHISSSLAPTSLISTSSARLHPSSGSALVIRRPALTSGLHSSGFASSLRPSGSVGFLTPSSSTLVLCRSGSPAVFWSPTCASVVRAVGIAMSHRILSAALARLHFGYTLVSFSTCSTSVSHCLGVISPSSTMAPPSIGSTMGSLLGYSLGPTVLLLLQVPPVSLAPPTICAALVPPVSCWVICMLSCRHLSPLPPSAVGPSTARGRAYHGGGVLLQP